jgi:hypothetical protein
VVTDPGWVIGTGVVVVAYWIVVGSAVATDPGWVVGTGVVVAELSLPHPATNSTIARITQPVWE